ncbi:MAG: biotin carboxylase N-terminal domain-containing protein [Actinomycetes bacterium]
MTVNRLLVANRGEIARRVFATCRRLGIETVAVHSDADAGLPFVAEADAAVRLPGNTPAETYLRGDLIIEAARRAGADAVHPGYGFLSENADFARQVVEAGLTWVGPRPESIEQMGSKVEAKKLVAASDVPVLTELSPADVTAEDLPLLVKASAGGGGRGMRVVRDLDAVAAAVAQASDEAASAFGDPTVFCEPYVEHGRHVEVQVVADSHGMILVLGERDCSIQRRHQKVIEETPAPGLSEETRAALHAAARATAEAVGYVGAGTVEFLLDPATEKFWFLEMNTRLQVEHPVTECVFGVDLVELQVAVAEGASLADLPASVATDAPVLAELSGDPSIGGRHAAETPQLLTGRRGHAVEVRLYAEDPARDWQPQSGRLTRFEVPDVDVDLLPPTSFGVRLDAGFRAGDEVGTHYDAMLAKVVAWGPTRAAALRRLAGVLARAEIHGVRTNRDLLVNVLRHEAFVAGEVSTDFFDRHDLAALASAPADVTAVRLSAFAAAVALAEQDRARRTVQRGVPVGWRNVVSAPQLTRFSLDTSATGGAAGAGEQVEVRSYGGRDGYMSADLTGLRVVAAGATDVVLEYDGTRRTFTVHTAGDGVLDVESSLGHVPLRRVPRFVDPADQVATGSLLAPMPGTVVSVAVEAGATVSAGDPVLVLEAMKMQHTVAAPHDGVVTDIPVSAGEQVAAGAVLAVVHEHDPDQGQPAGDSEGAGA